MKWDSNEINRPIKKMEVFLDDHVIEGTEKKHVSYIIKCKLNGKEFTAKRRYNDFFNLFTAVRDLVLNFS